MSEELKGIEVLRDQVLKLIGNLQDNKSLNLDGIHLRVFKEPKYEITYFLPKVHCLTLKSATVLGDWRVANVMLILKRGSKGEPYKRCLNLYLCPSSQFLL